MKDYACWNKIRDEPTKDCQLSCTRKDIPFTSPTWFGGWVESDPNDCMNRVRDKDEVKNMFNKFFEKR